MGNKLTNLPADIDSTLMDLAQFFETEDGDSLTYSNIMEWAEKANKKDISAMRNKIAYLADLDFDFDGDDAADAIYIATDIVNTIKAAS